MQDHHGGHPGSQPSHSYGRASPPLRFASRAKNIKNKPRVSRFKDTLLREFREEIARLKAQLEKRRGCWESDSRRKSSRREEGRVSPGPGYRRTGDRGLGSERGRMTTTTTTAAQPILETALDKNMENCLQERRRALEEEKAAIPGRPQSGERGEAEVAGGERDAGGI